jgi:hypothetical protein
MREMLAVGKMLVREKVYSRLEIKQGWKLAAKQGAGRARHRHQPK